MICDIANSSEAKVWAILMRKKKVPFEINISLPNVRHSIVLFSYYLCRRDL